MAQERKPVTTLLVRHLPESLPPETLKRLFVHYGASDLRACVAGRLKNCAFVDFEDEALAARAQSKLHRLRFLGKTLGVERARSQGVQVKQDDGNKRKPGEALLLPRPETRQQPAWEPQPIAPSLGVDYPFPPDLEYAYPPPDKSILSNITNALIAVPKFYTQVLHLMNKMNLPAPFRPALPAPPLPSKHSADLASDESELDSSGEEAEEDEHVVEHRTKKRRRQPILGPALAEGVTHEAAGVKAIVEPSKLVPSIKKKQPVIQIKINTKTEAKSKDEGKNEEEKPQEKQEAVATEARDVATIEELNNGKLSVAEAATHPLLKKYAPGNPSPVLYVKNLEKDVVPEDLFYVFGAFFSSLEEVQTEVNVKLMQEGRMKGQAFVRFPSVQLAQNALAGAHLYLLKGKPMIIQFGHKA